MMYLTMAFSAAPTSRDCVIFTLGLVTHEVMAVSTCRPRATEGTTVNYEKNHSFYSVMRYKAVFCNGKLDCLCLKNWFGVYDPMECTWDVSMLPPKCPTTFFPKDCWELNFMAEYKVAQRLLSLYYIFLMMFQFPWDAAQ
uniref:Uncharacterized protein n=1 Tax=Kalanchoe fedtschenkoi TaxID=63787 RepID=A0A7N0SYR2_KALFE